MTSKLHVSKIVPVGQSCRGIELPKEFKKGDFSEVVLNFNFTQYPIRRKIVKSDGKPYLSIPKDVCPCVGEMVTFTIQDLKRD